MGANTFGKVFTLTTFGESHGPMIGGVIDGCPPNLEIDVAKIAHEMQRRQLAKSRFTSQRKESDKVEIVSGVFEGKTLGTPICLLIQNEDAKSKDYSEIADVYRPGHGDYTYDKKYGIRDYRGGGRSSARETAVRVAAGSIAKMMLAQHGIQIRGYISQIGPLKVDTTRFDWGEVERNPFFCPDPQLVPDYEALIDCLRKEGDSIGAKVDVLASGVPVGLGEPIYQKLSSNLAQGLMSINAVKGVEIGAGFDCIEQKGSEHRDEMKSEGFLSNHAGGILAGISTGQEITASVAFKPTSSITKPGQTLDTSSQETSVVTKGRHDPCVALRAVPIVEAMVALTLADHWLRYFGYQNSD